MTKLYNSRRRAIRQQNRRLAAVEPNRDRIDGTVFAISGSIYVPGTTQYVWVHEWGIQSSTLQAYKPPYVQVWEGAGVTIMRNPKAPDEWEIIKVHTSPYPPQVSQASNTSQTRAVVDDHAANHQWPTEATKGRDAVSTFAPAIAMLKSEADGTSLTITVGPLYYGIDAAREYFPGGTIDLTSHVPGTPGDYIRVLVYLDTTTNALDSTAGSTETFDWPPFPDTPTDGIASAYYTLEYGQTAIDQVSDYVDARRFLTENGGGGGATTFLGLTDTPASYAGQGGNVVAVNVGETALEFIAPGGTGTFTDAIDVTVSDAVTNVLTSTAAFRHRTSGTPAAGFGASLDFYLDDNGAEDQFAGLIGFSWNYAVHGSRLSQFHIQGVWGDYTIALGVITSSFWASADDLGNARGYGSVDLQTARSAATEVVTGSYGAIIAGARNTVSGFYNGVFAGYRNTIAGSTYSSAIVSGEYNSMSGSHSAIVAGKNNYVQSGVSYGAIVAGSLNNVSGDYGAVIAGKTNTASGVASVVVGGQNNTVSAPGAAIVGSRYGSSATDANYGVATGGWYPKLSQPAEVVGGSPIDTTTIKIRNIISSPATRYMSGGVTDNTWYTIYQNSTVGYNLIATSADNCAVFEIKVAGVEAGGNRWAYKIEGSCYIDTGTLTIDGTPTITVYQESDANYEVQVVANSGNLDVQFRRVGGTGYNIRWVAQMSAIVVAA